MPQRLRKESLVRRLFVVILFLWPVYNGQSCRRDYPEEARCFSGRWRRRQVRLIFGFHPFGNGGPSIFGKDRRSVRKSSFLVVEANILAVDEEEPA